MIDYSPFFSRLKELQLDSLASIFSTLTDNSVDIFNNGDYVKWQEAVDSLPAIEVEDTDLKADAVRAIADVDAAFLKDLKENLMVLHPWRKGPFDLFGMKIDTEWQSCIKWNRLKDSISSLRDKVILDVGCGNGYYCLKMIGEGAKAVVGIDPFLLYVMQYQALNKYYNCESSQVLPLGIDSIPSDLELFDTVFSMGVLYHRRDPHEHLNKLLCLLKPGGELVLETIIIESEKSEFLQPDGRYAKMRNVWEIPSPSMAVEWLIDAGFKDVEVVDISATTLDEQQKTDWMTFESLGDFLDPDDFSKTIEGYPAPVRGVFVAKK